MDLYIDPRFDTGNKEQDFRRQKAWLIGERIKCDNDFLYFTRFFFNAVEGKKFILNKHHYDLRDHFEDVMSYKVKLLNINIPPRCSKSEMLIFFICRGFGMRHSSNWLLITGSDKLRKNAAIKIRRIVTHPLFKLMYNFKLAKDQNNVDVLRSSQGGGIVTASIGGSITGFGAGEITEENMSVNKDTLKLIREFEGCQCWDDLNKVNDSVVENANNQKVSDLVFDTLMSRENSVDTPILHIQQRVGSSDVTASLMEYYGYNSETKKAKSDKHRFVIMPVIYPDGSLLWESKYPNWKIEELKNGERTSSTFMTQYMQDVTDVKGNLFKKEQFSFISANDMDSIEKHMNLAVNDVADQGTDNYSFPWGFVHDQRVYIRGWIYNTDELQFNAPRTATIINHEKILNVAIEINNMGNTHLNNISNLISSDVSLAGKHETGNKHGRIRNYAEAMRNRIVFLREEDQDSEYRNAIDHMFRYKSVDKENKKGKLDSPDSMALLMWMLLSDDSTHKIWEFM